MDILAVGDAQAGLAPNAHASELMPKCWITYLKRNGAEGGKMPITNSLVLGRGAECDVAIHLPDVELKHVQLTVDDTGSVWLDHFGKPDTTTLNGTSVSRRTRVMHEDEMRIRGRIFRFTIQGAAREQTEVRRAAKASPQAGPTRSPLQGGRNRILAESPQRGASMHAMDGQENGLARGTPRGVHGGGLGCTLSGGLARHTMDPCAPAEDLGEPVAPSPRATTLSNPLAADRTRGAPPRVELIEQLKSRRANQPADGVRPTSRQPPAASAQPKLSGTRGAGAEASSVIDELSLAMHKRRHLLSPADSDEASPTLATVQAQAGAPAPAPVPAKQGAAEPAGAAAVERAAACPVPTPSSLRAKKTAARIPSSVAAPMGDASAPAAPPVATPSEPIVSVAQQSPARALAAKPCAGGCSDGGGSDGASPREAGDEAEDDVTIDIADLLNAIDTADSPAPLATSRAEDTPSRANGAIGALALGLSSTPVANPMPSGAARATPSRSRALGSTVSARKNPLPPATPSEAAARYLVDSSASAVLQVERALCPSPALPAPSPSQKPSCEPPSAACDSPPVPVALHAALAAVRQPTPLKAPSSELASARRNKGNNVRRESVDGSPNLITFDQTLYGPLAAARTLVSTPVMLQPPPPRHTPQSTAANPPPSLLAAFSAVSAGSPALVQKRAAVNTPVAPALLHDFTASVSKVGAPPSLLRQPTPSKTIGMSILANKTPAALRSGEDDLAASAKRAPLQTPALEGTAHLDIGGSARKAAGVQGSCKQMTPAVHKTPAALRSGEDDLAASAKRAPPQTPALEATAHLDIGGSARKAAGVQGSCKQMTPAVHKTPAALRSGEDDLAASAKRAPPQTPALEATAHLDIGGSARKAAGAQGSCKQMTPAVHKTPAALRSGEDDLAASAKRAPPQTPVLEATAHLDIGGSARKAAGVQGSCKQMTPAVHKTPAALRSGEDDLAASAKRAPPQTPALEATAHLDIGGSARKAAGAQGSCKQMTPAVHKTPAALRSGEDDLAASAKRAPPQTPALEGTAHLDIGGSARKAAGAQGSCKQMTPAVHKTPAALRSGEDDLAASAKRAPPQTPALEGTAHLDIGGSARKAAGAQGSCKQMTPAVHKTPAALRSGEDDLAASAKRAPPQTPALEGTAHMDIGGSARKAAGAQGSCKQMTPAVHKTPAALRSGEDDLAASAKRAPPQTPALEATAHLDIGGSARKAAGAQGSCKQMTPAVHKTPAALRSGEDDLAASAKRAPPQTPALEATAHLDIGGSARKAAGAQGSCKQMTPAVHKTPAALRSGEDDLAASAKRAPPQTPALEGTAHLDIGGSARKAAGAQGSCKQMTPAVHKTPAALRSGEDDLAASAKRAPPQTPALEATAHLDIGGSARKAAGAQGSCKQMTPAVHKTPAALRSGEDDLAASAKRAPPQTPALEGTAHMDIGGSARKAANVQGSCKQMTPAVHKTPAALRSGEDDLAASAKRAPPQTPALEATAHMDIGGSARKAAGAQGSCKQMTPAVHKTPAALRSGEDDLAASAKRVTVHTPLPGSDQPRRDSDETSLLRHSAAAPESLPRACLINGRVFVWSKADERATPPPPPPRLPVTNQVAHDCTLPIDGAHGVGCGSDGVALSDSPAVSEAASIPDVFSAPTGGERSSLLAFSTALEFAEPRAVGGSVVGTAAHDARDCPTATPRSFVPLPNSSAAVRMPNALAEPIDTQDVDTTLGSPVGVCALSATTPAAGSCARAPSSARFSAVTRGKFTPRVPLEQLAAGASIEGSFTPAAFFSLDATPAADRRVDAAGLPPAIAHGNGAPLDAELELVGTIALADAAGGMDEASLAKFCARGTPMLVAAVALGAQGARERSATRASDSEGAQLLGARLPADVEQAAVRVRLALRAPDPLTGAFECEATFSFRQDNDPRESGALAVSPLPPFPPLHDADVATAPGAAGASVCSTRQIARSAVPSPSPMRATPSSGRRSARAAGSAKAACEQTPMASPAADDAARAGADGVDENVHSHRAQARGTRASIAAHATGSAATCRTARLTSPSPLATRNAVAAEANAAAAKTAQAEAASVHDECVALAQPGEGVRAGADGERPAADEPACDALPQLGLDNLCGVRTVPAADPGAAAEQAVRADGPDAQVAVDSSSTPTQPLDGASSVNAPASVGAKHLQPEAPAPRATRRGAAGAPTPHARGTKRGVQLAEAPSAQPEAQAAAASPEAALLACAHGVAPPTVVGDSAAVGARPASPAPAECGGARGKRHCRRVSFAGSLVTAEHEVLIKKLDRGSSRGAHADDAPDAPLALPAGPTSRRRSMSAQQALEVVQQAAEEEDAAAFAQLPHNGASPSSSQPGPAVQAVDTGAGEQAAAPSDPLDAQPPAEVHAQLQRAQADECTVGSSDPADAQPPVEAQQEVDVSPGAKPAPAADALPAVQAAVEAPAATAPVVNAREQRGKGGKRPRACTVLDAERPPSEQAAVSALDEVPTAPVAKAAGGTEEQVDATVARGSAQPAKRARATAAAKAEVVTPTAGEPPRRATRRAVASAVGGASGDDKPASVDPVELAGAPKPIKRARAPKAAQPEAAADEADVNPRRSTRRRA